MASRPSGNTHRVTTFLLIIGALAGLHQLFSHFPAITSNLRASLQHALPVSGFCTKDVGDGVCCDLFLAAEPCVEVCRKQHLDRETFTITEEYDECAHQCLSGYRSTCTKEQKQLDEDGALGGVGIMLKGLKTPAAT